MKRERLIEILSYHDGLKIEVVVDLILDEIEKSKAPDKAGEREGLEADREQRALTILRRMCADERLVIEQRVQETAFWKSALEMADKDIAALAAIPTPPLSPDSTGPASVPESVRRFVEHCEHKVYPLVRDAWALNNKQSAAFIDALNAARAALTPSAPIPAPAGDVPGEAQTKLST